MRNIYAIAVVPFAGWLLWSSPAVAQVNSIETQTYSFTNAQYMLEPGDEISILVYGYEEYTGLHLVRSDGSITLPVLGSVGVSGHTLDSLTAALTEQLNVYLVEPSVSVDLVTPRPINIFISGEVHRPGPVQLEEEADPTLLTALSAVGGVTRRADIRQVTVRRSLSNGQVSVISLNLWESLWPEEGVDDQSPNHLGDIVLRDDDEIFIPQLSPEDDSIDRRLLAQSTFAPDTVRVRVVGEVNDPGEVEVSPNSSLSSAVAIAGGPTGDAALSRVEFIRLSEEGAIERQEVDLRNLSDEIQVQEGDVVIVPERNSSSILDWAGRILTPFNSLFTIFQRIDQLSR
ncbi:MAG: polysaccharide biosynthesis/export family protein [Cyanobacteria bacterium J06638_22]